LNIETANTSFYVNKLKARQACITRPIARHPLVLLERLRSEEKLKQLTKSLEARVAEPTEHRQQVSTSRKAVLTASRLESISRNSVDGFPNRHLRMILTDERISRR
jgi:hypothetical protein